MWRYTGDGEYYEGVPARDLDDDEVAALTEEQHAAVMSGRLYQRETPATTARQEDSDGR